MKRRLIAYASIPVVLLLMGCLDLGLIYNGRFNGPRGSGIFGLGVGDGAVHAFKLGPDPFHPPGFTISGVVMSPAQWVRGDHSVYYSRPQLEPRVSLRNPFVPPIVQSEFLDGPFATRAYHLSALVLIPFWLIALFAGLLLFVPIHRRRKRLAAAEPGTEPNA